MEAKKGGEENPEGWQWALWEGDLQFPSHDGLVMGGTRNANPTIPD